MPSWAKVVLVGEIQPGEDIGESVRSVGSLTPTAPEVDHLQSEQVKPSMIFNDKVSKYSAMFVYSKSDINMKRTFSPPT